MPEHTRIRRRRSFQSDELDQLKRKRFEREFEERRARRKKQLKQARRETKSSDVAMLPAERLSDAILVTDAVLATEGEEADRRRKERRGRRATISSGLETFPVTTFLDLDTSRLVLPEIDLDLEAAIEKSLAEPVIGEAEAEPVIAAAAPEPVGGGAAVPVGGGVTAATEEVKFGGPFNTAGLAKGGTVPASYPGEAHHLPAGQNHTGCAKGTVWVRTAGESYSKVDTEPGQPTNLGLYNSGEDWSRTGGLARDKSRKQTATRMHAINHHLDPTWTQNDPANIFLGTAKSNSRHERLVERRVKKIAELPGNALGYQNAMHHAVETQETTTGPNLLFWPLANTPDDGVVKTGQRHLANLSKTTHQATFSDGAAGPSPNLVPGSVMVVDAATPKNNYHHAWLRYEVTPHYPGAYAGLPQYVQDNVDHEEAFVNGMAPGAKKTTLTQRIADFKDWALEAFPTDFQCRVEYYTASYDKTKPYHRTIEQGGYSAGA